MRTILIALLFTANACFAQSGGWQLEIMPGIAGYKGDLTQSYVPANTIGPSVALNLKYDFGDMIILRGGFAWAKISADDMDNKSSYLKERGLNFKTDIWEASLCAEVNILDPEAYDAYPYMFTGFGLFRFNPYTYDEDGKKVYLRPLNTEGQGLSEYPDRKQYALIQFCVPFGGGFKVKLNERTSIAFEAGVRFLFTDYLDDVSSTYVNEQVLLTKKGPKAVELAFRKNSWAKEGDMRGNSGKNDMYVFSGVKAIFNIGRWKE
jgi:hypothetical protein